MQIKERKSIFQNGILTIISLSIIIAKIVSIKLSSLLEVMNEVYFFNFFILEDFLVRCLDLIVNLIK